MVKSRRDARKSWTPWIALLVRSAIMLAACGSGEGSPSTAASEPAASEPAASEPTASEPGERMGGLNRSRCESGV